MAVRLRPAASAVAALVAVVALAAVLGPAVAARVGATPVDPRRYVPPPQVDTLDENPLIRISGWALDPDQHLLDVSLSGPGRPGAGGGVRVRLAVLNDYDGVTWRVGATYRSAGRVLPPPIGPAGPVDEPTGRPATHARQEITIAGLAGRLLPAVADPREVDGVRVAYDQGSGTLLSPEGLTTGVRYTVDSIVDEPEVNLLATADVPAGPAVARVLALGEGVPPQLQRLVDQLGEDSGAAYERATAIEQFLSEHYRLVADAPSGHAYPNLSFFLFGPPGGGGQRGTSEQFAASFAVLGRLMGLPTRVVVGFQTRSGTPRIRGADAFAWPEVLFSGIGWVPFDPLPHPDTQPRPVEEDFRPKPETSTPPPSTAPTPTLPASPSATASAAAAAPSTSSGPGLPLVAGGLAAVMVLLLGGYATAVPLLRRAQRRRRLDAGDPAGRVAGAWLEVTDALRLAGRPARAHLAASEVAAHAATATQPRDKRQSVRVRPPAPPVPAPPPIADLATLVNHTTFSPTPIGEAHARYAVDQAVAYASALRARRPWWRRLLWSLHPGPLRWHRGR